MANLNLYLGGTPGGTDGTLIDPTVGMALSGIYPVDANTRYSYFPLSLRCNPGFIATGVRLTPLNGMIGFLGIQADTGGVLAFSGAHGGFDIAPAMSNINTNWSLGIRSSGNFRLYLGNYWTEVSQIGSANVTVIGVAYGNNSTTNILQNALSISFIEGTA